MSYSGYCTDCGYDSNIQNFIEESEYDNFWGREYLYYICPECSGVVEIYKNIEKLDDNNNSSKIEK